jgi:molecular chaperone GrpE
MSDNPKRDASAQGASAGPAASDETRSAQNTGGEEASSASSSGEASNAGGAGAGGAGAAGNGGPSNASASAAAPPSAEERIAQLEAEKAQLAREKQDNWDRLLRTTADLDNLRKRSRRELDDARTEARSKVLREMLPVIDNLERAVEHAESTQSGTSVASLIEGVKLVLRQFAQALERCDVVPIEAAGKPFDPNLHEAISQVETAEHAPGSVVQALQKGYTIGNRLLRPALVVVAKAPPEPAPGSAGANGADGDSGAPGAGHGSSSGEA